MLNVEKFDAVLQPDELLADIEALGTWRKSVKYRKDAIMRHLESLTSAMRPRTNQLRQSSV